jgi:arylsulfatase A-like enzyme
VLRDQGYNTFALGKWHLAPMYETTPAGPYDNWPLGRGFERYYGFLDGETDQFAPELTYDNHRIETPRRPGYHLTEDLIDHSIEFVRDQVSVKPDSPFFLYLAFGATHAPHQAPKEFIDRYKGVYDKGWDKIREERLARQKQIGIAPPTAELSPRNPGVKAWDDLSADEKRLFIRFQETYAGFLEHTDYHLGRLLSFLEQIGKMQNTIVFLISDNGASQEGGPNGMVNDTMYFNGVPADVKSNLEHIDEIGGPQSHPNYPWGWAQAGNTPFKRYKQNVHFGGVRDPLIVYWPAGIKDKGGVRTQFHHVIDIYPTVLELLGVKSPDTYRGVPQLPVAGISLAYTFDEPKAAGRRATQYFEMLGHRSIYHDGWKADVFHVKGVPFDQDKWELYHVAEDYSEVHDLASKFPDKLKELQDLWWSEARKYGVPPLDDRTFEFFGMRHPGAPNDRTEFTYYPGMAHLSTGATPVFRDRSYSITAHIEPDGKCQGVLLAYGNHGGGLVLYVKDNRLVYEYNYLGTITKIVSDAEVPAGATALGFEFVRSGPYKGSGVLYADGKKIGEGQIPRTAPIVTSFEGLDVGRDSLSQVSESYHGEFPFSGAIKNITIKLK